MLALTVVTAVQRFIKVWQSAAVAPVVEAKREIRRSRRQSRRVARADRMAQVRIRRRRPQP